MTNPTNANDPQNTLHRLKTLLTATRNHNTHHHRPYCPTCEDLSTKLTDLLEEIK